MSECVRIEVIAARGGVPDAVLYPATIAPTSHEGDVRIHSTFRDLRLFERLGARLLQRPGEPLFAAKLSLRWGCMVGCTPEFAAWWSARAGRPRGFFLEVLS